MRGGRYMLNSQSNLRDHRSPRAEAAVKAPEPFREEELMNRTTSKKTVTTNKDNQSLNNSHVVVLEHVQHHDQSPYQVKKPEPIQIESGGRISTSTKKPSQEEKETLTSLSQSEKSQQQLLAGGISSKPKTLGERYNMITSPKGSSGIQALQFAEEYK